MQRILLSNSNTRCPYKCKYCFTRFEQYRKSLTFENIQKNPELIDGIDIIYPACDFDLFATKDPIITLWQMLELRKSISISTKAALSELIVEKIAEIGQALAEYGHILKIGISFSTKYNIPFWESRTSNYHLRLKNLELLSKFKVPFCVVLKPVLVEVSMNEYYEIVQDISNYNAPLLLGEEYLNFGNLDTLMSRRPLVKVKSRRVNWLCGNPEWPISKVQDHITHIKTHAESMNVKCFDSDLNLMEWLISEHNPTIKTTSFMV